MHPFIRSHHVRSPAVADSTVGSSLNHLPIRASHVVVALLAGLLTGLSAADSTPVSVPDPYGLGERLAIIDYLHQQHVDVPADADLDSLRDLYRTTAAALDPAVAEQARQRQRIADLRKHLIEQYGVTLSPDATEDQLLALTKAQEEKVYQETNDALQHDQEMAPPSDVPQRSSATASQSGPPAAAPSPRMAPASNTPASGITGGTVRLSDEPKFLELGYEMEQMEAPITLYLKHLEPSAGRIAVPVAIWNNDTTAHDVDVRISTTDKRQEITTRIGPHQQYLTQLSFPFDFMERVTGEIISDKEVP